MQWMKLTWKPGRKKKQKQRKRKKGNGIKGFQPSNKSKLVKKSRKPVRPSLRLVEALIDSFYCARKQLSARGFALLKDRWR